MASMACRLVVGGSSRIQVCEIHNANKIVNKLLILCKNRATPNFYGLFFPQKWGVMDWALTVFHPLSRPVSPLGIRNMSSWYVPLAVSAVSWQKIRSQWKGRNGRGIK